MKNKGWEAESDKQGSKSGERNWGLAGWSLAILMSVSFPAGNGWARHQAPGAASERLHLTVGVYIYAPIPQYELATAERVASKIFQNVGVELSWVNCPMTGLAAHLNLACTAPYAPTDIHLNIAQDLPQGSGVGKFAMGLAVTPPPPNHGEIASISYARARKLLTDTHELTLGQLLGHGIAHEIGHLTLGTNSHSASGLMCAHWNVNELKLAAYAELRFSEEQAATIRADVRTRRLQQEAAGSEQVISQR
jgi:hypothetical protein